MLRAGEQAMEWLQWDRIRGRLACAGAPPEPEVWFSPNREGAPAPMGSMLECKAWSCAGMRKPPVREVA